MTCIERERLEVLTLAMLDGELSRAEVEELESLLSDADAQRLHGMLLEQEGALRGERTVVDVVARTLSELASSERVERGVLASIAQVHTTERRAAGWRAGWRLAAAAAAVLFVMLGGSAAWISTWSAAPQEALVFASRTIEPGASPNFRVQLRHAQTLVPYAGNTVRFSLVSADGVETWVAQAKTDSTGVARVEQVVPEGLAEGDYTLRVSTSMAGYAPQLTRALTVRRAYRIYVTTDKPRYQPGQIMHLRALAMTATGLLPAAERRLTFEVRDAKGNLVMERPLSTSSHGLAWTDFELAEQVNTGRYTVSARIGSTVSERSPVVERYVLPKLKVAVQTDAPYYAPGANIEGKVSATYIFGESVENANVEVSVKDAASDVLMATVSAHRIEAGKWGFSVPIPARFGALQAGTLALEVGVTDRAGFHNEQRIERTVTSEPFLVDLVVAGGRVIQGVSNRFYLSFRTPDARPAKVEGTLGGVPFEAGAAGIAEVSLPPSDRPTATLVVAGMRQEIPVHAVAGVVLHTDRSVYAGGASVKLTVLASSPVGTAFVDAIQGSRTLWTQAVALKGGGAELTFDLPADVHGPLRLRVFRASDDSDIQRSDRVVVVQGRRGLDVTASSDREVYRPGDIAKLRIAVTKDGVPAPAAVSVAGVDEAVFAMSETRPGMQRTFFELNRDLEAPPVSTYPLERVMALKGETRERAAGAALATIASPDDLVPVTGPEGYRARQEQVERERSASLRTVGGAVLLVPLLLCWLLLIITLARLGPAAWSPSRTSVPADPALAGAMRRVVLAWVGGLVIPPVLAFFGGDFAGEDAAVFAALLGFVVAEELLRAAVKAVGSRAALSVVPYAYATCGLGSAGLIVGAQQRLLPSDLYDLAIVITFAGWVLVAGVLAAAGRNLATGCSRAGVVWLVFSRATLAASPALLLLLMVRGGDMEPATVSNSEPTNSIHAATVPTVAADQSEPSTSTRVRSHFPETLLWQPQLITDERGQIELDVPLADSITTWRLSMSAVSTAGELGAAEQSLRVFQPFFVEPNLPLSLTQDDVVTVPVAVFNYLDEEQRVTVEVETADWLEIAGATKRTVTLAPREVKKVAFVVKALTAGRQRFRVMASTGQLSDAVERELVVEPNGQRVAVVQSGELKTTVELAVDVPDDAIAGGEDLVLKLYPGAFSQVAEGMEGVFRMPSGCFEQTSSVTYPSLLVLDYLRSNESLQPELAAKAQRNIGLGYQRLLSFEVPGGGFEWFGKSPAHPVLTAYGLMEFVDMKRIRSVDPAMIERTQQWLTKQQRADGTWTMPSPGITEGATNAYQGEDVRTTAYIAWALAESGVKDPALARALSVLEGAIDSASDSYTRALIANALVAGGHPAAARAVARVSSSHRTSGDHAFWTSTGRGLTHGHGDALSVEVTGLSAYVLLRAKFDVALAHRALAWLIAQRDAHGTWRSTQATVAAMRALLAATGSSEITSDVTVDVVVDGESVKRIAITPDTADVFRLVSLRSAIRRGARKVELRSSGGGTIAYQLVATHYRPWPTAPTAKEIELRLSYGDSEVSVGDVLHARAQLLNKRTEALAMAMVEVPLVPGFRLDRTSLDELVQARIIERYELRDAKIALYVRALAANARIVLPYRLVAAQPARVRALPALAYLYYEPEVSDITQPVSLTVR